MANDISGAAQAVPAATLREMIERIGLLAPELVDPTRAAPTGSATQSNYLGVGISMAMVSLTDPQCHTNCSFTGKLVWTFGSRQRSCGAVSLPTGVEIVGPLVLVDVLSVYKFKIDTTGRLGPSPTLSTTTYQNVRNWRDASLVPAVDPPSSGGWAVKTCTT